MKRKGEGLSVVFFLMITLSLLLSKVEGGRLSLFEAGVSIVDQDLSTPANRRAYNATIYYQDDDGLSVPGSNPIQRMRTDVYLASSGQTLSFLDIYENVRLIDYYYFNFFCKYCVFVYYIELFSVLKIQKDMGRIYNLLGWLQLPRYFPQPVASIVGQPQRNGYTHQRQPIQMVLQSYRRDAVRNVGYR